MGEGVFNILDARGSPRRSSGVHTAVLDYLVCTGLIEHYYVGGVSRDKGIGTGQTLCHNWPSAFAKSYFEGRRYLDDPIMQVCRNARGTISQRQVAEALADSDMSLVTESKAQGMSIPACIIISAGGNSFGVVQFYRAATFSAEELGLLSLIAPSIHRSARSAYFSSLSRTHDILSPRERECLAWSSVGKSSWEIGEILGIAKQTVDVHLKSAIQKLDAGSRAHAVAEALRLGLID
jgi:LuxR family quorum sensing-dependent transcriptional regulator